MLLNAPIDPALLTNVTVRWDPIGGADDLRTIYRGPDLAHLAGNYGAASFISPTDSRSELFSGAELLAKGDIDRKVAYGSLAFARAAARAVSFVERTGADILPGGDLPDGTFEIFTTNLSGDGAPGRPEFTVMRGRIDEAPAALRELLLTSSAFVAGRPA